MKYCSICLQPDTRPNTYFGADGLCPACNYYFKLSAVDDWEERYQDLLKLLVPYRKKPGQGFDCIVGVSGGKDSTRQALWARDKLGLKPLLVCMGYPPQQITERGADNISNLVDLGFDVIFWTLSPETWRNVVKEGFLRFTNWAKASEQAIISSVPQLAIKYGIKLILWGENPGLQLGDMKTIGKTGYDGNNLRHMNTVSGGGLEWLLSAGYKAKELIPYLYPSVSEFDQHNIQIIYLGWFWRDWSLINNAMYSCTNGLKVRDDSVNNTGDLWGVSSLDEDWVTLNQMIKYYKFGFGRVSDYVNEEIRQARMTRSEGISIVEQFDHSCGGDYIESFCAYIDISVEKFWEQVRGAVNKNLFWVDKDGSIHRKFKVGRGL